MQNSLHPQCEKIFLSPKKIVDFSILNKIEEGYLNSEFCYFDLQDLFTQL